MSTSGSGSVLDAFLAWFRRRGLAAQLLVTLVLFGALFGFGLLTAGIGPLVLVVLVLVDHWRRG